MEQAAFESPLLAMLVCNAMKNRANAMALDLVVDAYGTSARKLAHFVSPLNMRAPQRSKSR